MDSVLLKQCDILATGDVFLDTKKKGDNPFTYKVEELMKSSKVILINLETTIGSDYNATEKAYTFNIPENKISYLTQFREVIANVANNHTLDYKDEGFKSTIKILAKNKIHTIGSKLENELCVKQFNGIKIGFLAYFGCGNSLISGLDETTIKNNIQELKANKVTRIIISLHWGEEYVLYPSPKQQNLARKIIDYGADIIIGHHPHVSQGIEHYKNGIIFYSLGNFNFNVNHKYHNKLVTTKFSYCVKIKLDSNNVIEYEIIPIYINDNFQPCLFSNNNGINILKHINYISKPLYNNINFLFWISHASKHYFKNHLPSFFKRIQTYGINHFIQFLFWLIHPANYKYYFGLIISPFYKVFCSQKKYHHF